MRCFADVLPVRRAPQRRIVGLEPASRARAVFLNLFAGQAPTGLDRVAAKLDLQQDLFVAELVYRPAQVAVAANFVPLSWIRFKW